MRTIEYSNCNGVNHVKRVNAFVYRLITISSMIDFEKNS